MLLQQQHMIDILLVLSSDSNCELEAGVSVLMVSLAHELQEMHGQQHAVTTGAAR